MISKKSSFLLGSSVVGVTGLIAFSTMLSKQQEKKRQERVKREVRDCFSQLGSILVLYVNHFESDKITTTGGVVLTDGRTFRFVHQRGDISYVEEKK